MSDLFYDALTLVGRPTFWVSSRPTVVDAHFTQRPGGYILAANHTSPYDVPVLMRHCRRRIDFVSITEIFQNPLTAWLYGSMNAFPLDRRRPDAGTVRVILDRLARGRVVGMFPEGSIRLTDQSVVRTRTIRPGIGRLARIAGVPIVPCVIDGSGGYGRVRSWLPTRSMRYGVAFGKPIKAADEDRDTEAELVDAFVELHARLTGFMDA